MLWWLALNIAEACTRMSIPPEMSVVPPATALPPGAHLSVRLRGPWKPEQVADAASNYRLRGPDGELIQWTPKYLGRFIRFTPARPLQPGHHHIERRVTYSGGRQLSVSEARQQAVDTWVWYPEERVVIATTDEGPPEPPGVVEWSRRGLGSNNSCGPYSSITARFEVSAHTADVELELQGVGTIGVGFVSPKGGYIHYGDDSNFGAPSPLDPEGDVVVRVVAVGADGRRTPGAWRRLGPAETESERTPWPNRAYPSPPSWSSLPYESRVGPTDAVTSRCGALVRAGGMTHTPNSDSGTRFQFGPDGAEHRIEVRENLLVVDGQPIPIQGLRERARPWIRWKGTSVVVGFGDGKGGTVLVGIDNQAEAWRTTQPGSLRQLDASGDHPLLTTAEGDRRYVREIRRGRVHGPIVEVLQPPVVSSADVFSINGRRVGGAESARRLVRAVVRGADVYAVLEYDDGLVLVAARDGRIRWRQRLAGQQIRTLTHDDRGVVVGWSQSDPVTLHVEEVISFGGRSVSAVGTSWTRSYALSDAGDGAKQVTFGDGEAVLWYGNDAFWLTVREQNGVQLPGRRVMGGRPDALALFVEGDEILTRWAMDVPQRALAQRWRCEGGRTLGAPLRR